MRRGMAPLMSQGAIRMNINHSRCQFAGWAALYVGVLLALTGCGANLASVAHPEPSVTGYQVSSLFDPAGHSIAVLPDGRYRVTSTGSAGTPKDRLEKIAIARAAEYGAEMHKKWFQISQPVHTIRCAKGDYSDKGVRVAKPKVGYAVADIDVTYADAASDATFKPVRGTAETLKGELQSEVVPPDVQSQAATEVYAQCGR
jgi:hypothetical protein